MKAVICAEHGNIHITSFGTLWTSCECGNVRVKWLDPEAGTVVVAARVKERVRMLGLNNRYLISALRNPTMSWENYQDAHSISTDAPGFIFDKTKAGCWAVVMEVGRTSDVRWATAEEWQDAFGVTSG